MKPTENDKEKRKIQILRNAAKCLEGQWNETAVERGLGITILSTKGIEKGFKVI